MLPQVAKDHPAVTIVVVAVLVLLFALWLWTFAFTNSSGGLEQTPVTTTK